MNNEYYIFPKFPLIRVINYLPGDIIMDIPGNIYQVNSFDEPELIVPTILYKEFQDKGIKGLANKNQEHLFTKWSEYEIEQYFRNKG